MKILLAVDGSNASRHAVSNLVRHLDWFKVQPQIDLVFVHLPVPPVGAIHGIAINDETLAKYYEQDAEELLTPIKQQLQQAGLNFRTHLLVGNVAEEISNFAQHNKSDMIYMGTRGMGAVGRLVLGSTATKVLHVASIPVMLVPDREHVEAREFEPSAMRT